MSHRLYQEFQGLAGKPVEITCHGGEVHRGVVDHCDRTHVYIRPILDDGPGGPPARGTFLWGGFGGSFAGGFLGGLFGVALGSIAFYRPYGPFFY
ncbi:MAG TPA: hypothetical protein VFK44_00085 [Bacillales bacterium]|nr:hypothetical protein [Bacillales bacterium]